MSANFFRPAKSATHTISIGAFLRNHIGTGSMKSGWNERKFGSKSQKLIASILAVIGISRVYAVAKELEAEEIDPLANLPQLDDLGGLGELCLPGLSYAAANEENHDHDHVGRPYAHADHGYQSAWQHDPFASRYANKYANDHDAGRHNGHSRTDDHSRHENPAEHHSTHQNHTGHSAHSAHAKGNAGHHDNHNVSMNGEHNSHHEMNSAHDFASACVTTPANHSGHSENHAAHDMSAHSHGSHPHHEVVVSEDQITPEEGDAALHHDHSMVAETTGTEIDDITAAFQGFSLEDNAPADSHAAHHDHGATLGMMDLPPAEDIAAMTVPPVL